ncbi:nicotinamide riboside transporter PnuC [Shimazuella sp. AN120528]|uniref:nicotinamide riboside transporter PnuC n=1 Tax=Shimazuella soli TaxID=1892854 RepID=UPI001F0EBD61|nr:nicotinamide riboside transporter PnuC [Shimazuella soli]MCH5585824.1 nicotinamide riboside transporter PnuC [Shimazuella soli]
MKKSLGEGLIYVCMLVCAYLSASSLEMVATLTGLLCVWLTTKENIWCWPIGLINVGCFFFMFYEAKLYADMTLQVVFFILSIQGWIVWLTKRQSADVRPTKKLTAMMMFVLCIVLVVVTIAWGYVLTHYTDASIPYLDAFIATLSVIAQYLLSSKILENWHVWIAVDVLSVGMYLYKGLYSVAFLYTVFLVIAILGLISWRKTYLLAKGHH